MHAFRTTDTPHNAQIIHEAKALTAEENRLRSRLDRRIGWLALLIVRPDADIPEHRSPARISIQSDNDRQRVDPSTMYEDWAQELTTTTLDEQDELDSSVIVELGPAAEFAASSIELLMVEISELRQCIDAIAARRIQLYTSDVTAAQTAETCVEFRSEPITRPATTRSTARQPIIDRKGIPKNTGIGEQIMDILIDNPGTWFSYDELGQMVYAGVTDPRTRQRRVSQIFSNNLYQNGKTSSKTFEHRLDGYWKLEQEEIRQIDPRTGKHVNHAKPRLRWRVVQAEHPLDTQD